MELNRLPNERNRFVAVSIFALAMAWVESAVVFYLRTMIDRIEPHQPHPLPIVGGLVGAELVREAATIVMLAAVGWLTGGNPRTRFGYFLIAFGLWDLGYYAFLKILTGWPHSPFSWDLLFLLPVPWWGPVLAPALIAILMVVLGWQITHPSHDGRTAWPGPRSWIIAGAGSLIALYAFMKDALAVVPQGEAALRELLPTEFAWLLFLWGFALMTTPSWDILGNGRPVRTSD